MEIKQTYKPIAPVNIGVDKDTINDFARKYNLEIEQVYNILNRYKQRKVTFSKDGDYWNITENGASLSVAHNGNIVYCVYRIDGDVEQQVIAGVKRDDTNVILESGEAFDGYMLFLSDDSQHGLGDNLSEDEIRTIREFTDRAEEANTAAQSAANVAETLVGEDYRKAYDNLLAIDDELAQAQTSANTATTKANEASASANNSSVSASQAALSAAEAQSYREQAKVIADPQGQAYLGQITQNADNIVSTLQFVKDVKGRMDMGSYLGNDVPFTTSFGFISKADGTIKSSSATQCSSSIDLLQYRKIAVTCKASGSTAAAFALYNRNNEFVYAYPSTDALENYVLDYNDLLMSYPTARYVRLTFPANYPQQVLSVEEKSLTNAIDDITISVSKGNLIDKENLLYNWALTNGEWSYKDGAISSNKIYYIPKQTITVKGIRAYNYDFLYVAYFNEKDEFIVREQYNFGDSTNKIASFIGLDQYNGYSIAYCRIIIASTSSIAKATDLNTILAVYGTDVSTYQKYLDEKYVHRSRIFPPSEDSRKELKLFAIGNSYAGDALAYVPFILKKLCPNIKLTIGIAYYAGCSLQQHLDFATNESAAYVYQKNVDGNAWVETPNSTLNTMLADEQWDIIMLQQNSSNAHKPATYQPYLNQLISWVYNHINYPIKLAWLLTPSYGKLAEASADRCREIINAVQTNIVPLPIELIFPCGVAIQNARTTDLKYLGTDGYLMHNDHLQEGIASQTEAYTVILKLLELVGESHKSILGEQTRCTTEWASGKNIIGQNGDFVGSNDENCFIAQKCAIMAVKKPFEISNIQ